MDLCQVLTHAVDIGEKIAPQTASKWDDVLLLGLRIAKQRACKESLFATPAGVSPETAAKAEQFADELLAACDCDDCKCD